MKLFLPNRPTARCAPSGPTAQHPPEPSAKVGPSGLHCPRVEPGRRLGGHMPLIMSLLCSLLVLDKHVVRIPPDEVAWFGATAQYAVVVRGDGKVRLWDLGSGERAGEFQIDGYRYSGGEFSLSATGGRLATIVHQADEAHLLVFSIPKGEVQIDLRLENESNQAVSISADGSAAIVVSPLD